MNKHIEDYLNHYLSGKDNDFAVLLTGKWGCGKTFFINKYIESNSDESYKIIKISLFGLKTTNQIDEQIFQILHPVLGHKYTKLATGIVKSAVKLGINLDLNNDSQSETKVSLNLPTIDNLFNSKTEHQKIIFIFDDLERTDINLKEVLGYISGFVEEGFNVIVVANEEELNRNDKQYKRFKEKVIGKSFEIQHDFSSILDDFTKNIEYIDKESVKKACKLAGYQNLRHVKQSIGDFNFVTKGIEDNYLKNKQFLSQFTFIFFALNIEIKVGKLTEKDVRIWSDFLLDSEEKEKHPLKKYQLGLSPLLPVENWVKILFRTQINYEELNDLIGRTHFFINKNQPSWVKLWHYNELEDDEFQKLMKDMIDKFERNEYTRPSILLHVISLLIYFQERKLYPYPISKIKKYMLLGLVNCYSNTIDRTHYLVEDIRGIDNGTGLGYMGHDIKAFKDIFEEFRKENRRLYDLDKNTTLINDFNQFLSDMTAGNDEGMVHFLLNKNEYLPIFANQDAQLFVTTLVKLTNKQRLRLGELLRARYSSSKSSDGKQYGSYLGAELEFWKKVKKYLANLNFSADERLTENSFKSFEIYIVDKNIEQMISHIPDGQQ